MGSISAEIIYANHDDWQSPLGVPDHSSWATFNPTRSANTLTDMADGTLEADFDTERAGAYTLKVEVDGQDVINSPYALLEMQPDSISAQNCVPVDVPASMYAGLPYSIKIQGRD